MLQAKTNLIIAALLLALGAALGAAFSRSQPVMAQGESTAAAAGRYSVVVTEATNLIVTDNQTNTLYFYLVEKGKQAGAKLLLRGSMDLNQVGRPIIIPKAYKHQ
jgi:hypothetical protein